MYMRMCWCACVDVHVHMDMCKYMCVYMCMCVCACVHVHVCMCMCACVHVHVCMCMCACACVHVHVCMCMCACACVHVHVCMCMCACACVHVHVCMCMCACACVHVHVCMCMCGCACVHVHIDNDFRFSFVDTIKMSLQNEKRLNNNNQRPRVCGISVDVGMLPCKIACYLFYSSLGCISPFANVFLVSIGLTASEAGFISGIGYVVSTIAGPCWGVLADKSGQRKLIFITLCLGIASSIFALPWVANRIKSSGLQSVSLESNSSFPSYQTESNSSFPSYQTDQRLVALQICRQNSSQIIIEEVKNISTSKDNRCHPKLIPFANSLFYSMFALLFIAYICLFPAQSFLDSIVTNIIKNSSTDQGYGHQRMFGAIGSGSTALVAGLAADHYEYSTMSKYTAVFFVFLPFILLVIPLVFVLFKQTSWETETNSDQIHDILGENEEDDIAITVGGMKEKEEERSRIRILKDLFLNLDNIIIMLTVLLVGILRSVMQSFLFLIINDEMNGSKSSMGFAMLMNSFSAAIMFFFAKRLIKILGGSIICVELGVLSWILRLLLISYIKNAWLVALPQVLQSIGFALYWSAMVEYVQQITSKEIYITMFTILSSTQFGAGGFLGNLIGGMVYNHYKGPVLCRSTALVAAVWLIILFLYFHGIGFIKKRLRSESKIMTADTDSII